jgi:hypothetical protein
LDRYAAPDENLVLVVMLGSAAYAEGFATEPPPPPRLRRVSP